MQSRAAFLTIFMDQSYTLTARMHAKVLPTNARSVYIVTQGRAAGRLNERARRMVIALLPASHGASLAPFDMAPVLSRDLFAGLDPTNLTPRDRSDRAPKPANHLVDASGARLTVLLPGTSPAQDR